MTLYYVFHTCYCMKMLFITGSIGCCCSGAFLGWKTVDKISVLKLFFSKECSGGVRHCTHLPSHCNTEESWSEQQSVSTLPIAPGLWQTGEGSPEAAQQSGKSNFSNSNDGVLKKKKSLKISLENLFASWLKLAHKVLRGRHGGGCKKAFCC